MRLILALALTLVIAATFVAGFAVGHARTNCGEVWHPDGSHRHECWIVHEMEG